MARGLKAFRGPSSYRRCEWCHAPVPSRYMICAQCGYDHGVSHAANKAANPGKFDRLTYAEWKQNQTEGGHK